ncbi:MAG: sensor histidine kinase, partial [Patescibacteria group bacterium]|nr:sensor histidine kinase [Patescibacteria group bacterium]
QELCVANENLRREQRLLKQSLKMHDRERQVISYEIHDGLAQQLVGAEMAFQLAGQSLAHENNGENVNYKMGMTLLGRCIGEARRLINGVRPPLLDEEGVISAIQNLLAEDANGHAQPEFHHPATIDRMDPVVENAVYRVVQEAVTNARQHSGSDRIRVSLAVEEERLHVEVQDWGCGFDPQQKKGKAVGLRGIKKRAKLLGGSAKIESEPGSGTRVMVSLPLAPADDDSEDSDF